MKIRCEKKDLQTAVNNVSRAAPSKSPIPALEGILFEATKEELKLTAYDTRIGIYTTLESTVMEAGCIVIPARFLSELVRRLPDGLVTIEADESFATTIRCGKTEFHVMGLDPESFPELNVVDAVQNIGIPEDILKSMINQTIFSVSTSESRPLYMGVLFEVGVSDLTLVAVDGYRLAKRSEQRRRERLNRCRRGPLPLGQQTRQPHGLILRQAGLNHKGILREGLHDKPHAVRLRRHARLHVARLPGRTFGRLRRGGRRLLLQTPHAELARRRRGGNLRRRLYEIRREHVGRRLARKHVR